MAKTQSERRIDARYTTPVRSSTSHTTIPSGLQPHDLAGPYHLASGLAVGEVPAADSATSFSWRQLLHSEIGSIGPDDHHNRQHSITSASDHTVTGAQYSVVGLSATNTLGVLATSSNGSNDFNTILRSNPTGGLELDHLDLDTDITVPTINSPSHMSILPGGNLTINPANDVIFPQAKTVRSDNFTAGIPIQGWWIGQYNGTGTPSNSRNAMQIYALTIDELRARTFVVDEVRVDRGEEFVTKSYGIVSRPFDTPSAVSGTVTAYFEDSPAISGAIFSDGDYLLFRIFDDSSGFTIANILFTVSDYTNETGDEQSWTLTLVEGLTEYEIRKGAVGWDWGQSGQGYIHSSVVDTSGAPYMDIRTWETGGGSGGPLDGDTTTHVRIGRLISALDSDMSPDGWGLYSDNAYLKGTVHAAGGVVVLDDDGIRIKLDADTQFSDQYAYTFHTTNNEELGGLYVGYQTITGLDTSFIALRSIGTDEFSTGISIDAITDQTAGVAAATSIGLSASNDDGNGMFALVNLIVTASEGRLEFDASTYARIDTEFHTENLLPITDDTHDIGSASFRYKDGYFSGTLHVEGGISGDTLSGSEWEHAGNMIIDANSGSNTTVTITNQGAGTASLDVEGDITLGGTIDGVNLSNFATTVALNTVTLTAGDGLTGGGDLTTNRTFNVGAGDGISVAADAVAVDSTVVRTTRTLTAGNGMTGGGTLAADRTFTLGTPSTLTASTSNAVTTSSHTHAITTSSNPGANAIILQSTSSGGLTLQSLAVQGSVDITNGGDLTVGANIFFVDASQGNIGINCAPDVQFDLDVFGNIRAQGWFVGKHALQIDGAVMICHYDGKLPASENTTGHTEGHMGQVASVATTPVFREGAFRASKALEVAEATTNLISNPEFAGASATGWSDFTGGTATGTRVVTATLPNLSTYSYRIIKSGGAAADNYGAWHGFSVTNGQTYTVTAWVRVTAISGGSQTVTMSLSNGFAGTNAVSITGTTTGWVRISTTEAATSTGTARVNIYIDSADTATLYIANVQAENKDHPTPYTPSSRSAQTVSYAEPATGQSWLTWTNCSFGGWYYVDFRSSLFGNHQRLFDIYRNDSNRWLVYQNASNSTITATNGTDSFSSSAILDTQAWTHIVFTVSGTTATIYINGVASGTVTTTVLQTGPPTVYVGTTSGGATPLNGRVDDFFIIGRALPESEVLAIYESNAPIFAETATFTFRLPNNLVWGDSDGLWVRTDDGSAAFGISGIDSKSWAGYTLDKGDLVIGNSSGHSVRWDHSAGTMTFVGNGAGVTAISGSNITTGTINASVVSVTNISASNITTGTLNAARIGAGSITADKLNVSVIDASGNISAASGDVVVNSNGIAVSAASSLPWALGGVGGISISASKAYRFDGNATVGTASGITSGEAQTVLYSETTGNGRVPHAVVDARVVATEANDEDAKVTLLSSRRITDLGVLKYTRIMLENLSSGSPISKITMSAASASELEIHMNGAVTISQYLTPVYINQGSGTGAVPVLKMRQLDTSEQFIDFVGTVGAGNAIEADTSVPATSTHKVRVTINGSTTGYMYIYGS